MSKETHPLFVWAKANGLKLKWLAQRAGISDGSMTKYINSRGAVPVAVRLAFETITSGAVRADEWPEVKQ